MPLDIQFTSDPIHHGTPPGLEEQSSEWCERLIVDIFYTIHGHLRRLGSLPLPSHINTTATDGKLKCTIVVSFERETDTS